MVKLYARKSLQKISAGNIRPKEVIIRRETSRSYIAKLKIPHLGYRKGYTAYNKKYWKKR